MEKFVKGDVVVIPFPFSDLSATKRRPALVLANLPGEDILLCQITSQGNDLFAIPLQSVDFVTGNLPSDSFIRATRIFTADKKLIVRKAGHISSVLHTEVVRQITTILER
jgi:mRNA interferase MazF